MRLNDVRVGRKLWIMLLATVLILATGAGLALNRMIHVMDETIDSVAEIEQRIAQASRWRGSTEIATMLVMGAAVTSDAVLAQQYEIKIEKATANADGLRESMVASTVDPVEKAALTKIEDGYGRVKAATAKAWELKGEGDVAETQNFADEQLAPLVERYLADQDEFIRILARHSLDIREQAQTRRHARIQIGRAHV